MDYKRDNVYHQSIALHAINMYRSLKHNWSLMIYVFNSPSDPLHNDVIRAYTSYPTFIHAVFLQSLPLASLRVTF